MKALLELSRFPNPETNLHLRTKSRDSGVASPATKARQDAPPKHLQTDPSNSGSGERRALQLNVARERRSSGYFQTTPDFAARAEEARKMLTSPQVIKELPFGLAAEKWIEYKSFTSPSGRARFVSPRSLIDLQQYVTTLNGVFEHMRLESIHVGHIREFQLMRASGKLSKKHCEVGPNKINQEVGTLIRVMKYANCWTPELEEVYMPLQREESDIPRALSPSEQEYWLAVASSHPGWRFVYWYSLLCFDCPMSTNEVRSLKLGDLDLNNNLLMIRVKNSKNKYRTRSIPLSDIARWALDRLIERASEAGATSPQHYLMPFRRSHTWHPDKPMTVSGIKKPWGQVRKAAGLAWFTPYGTRHTSNTRYAEAGTPIAVIMSMAGHISRKMQEHYTHISDQAKRKAVQSVSVKSAVLHRRNLSLSKHAG